MKFRSFLFFLLIALLFEGACFPAAAEGPGEARDIVGECQVSGSANPTLVKDLLSSAQYRSWPCPAGAFLTVDTPESTPAQGVMLSFLENVPALTVESDGQVIARYTESFQTDYIPFSTPVSHFTVRVDAVEGTAAEFCRLCVLSEGTLPGWVQQWQWMEDPCDLMLIATHPDDELLWFGGMLPTYAGEYQKKVTVVYMVGRNTRRRNELLAGLWACGVRYYPEIGPFPDGRASNIRVCQEDWGGADAAPSFVAQMIRKHRPQVVATQDVNGEYGHIHHTVTVQAVIDAVTSRAADENWGPASVAQYGAWQPRKLYVHLWRENQSVFDWRQPLSAFGGETSISVARRAFLMHESQQNGLHEVADYGSTDCRKFGLYWSSVGPDVKMNDLFENID